MIGLPVNDLIVPVGLLLGFVSSAKKRLSLPYTYLILIYVLVIFFCTTIKVNLSEGLMQLEIFSKRMGIFFMVLLIVDSAKKLKMVYKIIIIMTIFMVVQAIIQMKTGVDISGTAPRYDFVYKIERARWVGLWDGPNILAMAFILSIAFCLEFIFGPYGNLSKICNAVLTITFIHGVYLTKSRAGILCIVTAFSTYFYLKYKSKKEIAAAIIILLITLIFAPSRSLDVDIEDSSAKERTWVIEQGLNLSRANPIFGVGKGQYVKYTTRNLVAHNTYLQTLAETGIVGFFVFISITYLFLKYTYIAQAIQPKPISKDIELGSLTRGLFVSFVVYSVTAFFLSMEFDLLFFWWGLCAASLNIMMENRRDFFVRFGLKDVSIILTAMFVLVSMMYVVAHKL